MNYKPKQTLLHLAFLALTTSLALAAPPATQPTTQPAAPTTLLVVPLRSGPIIITGTLEASMDYMRVDVRLRQGERVLTGEASALGGLAALKNLQDINDLNDLLDGKKKAARDEHFSAFLDTGASANVISKNTVARFGIDAAPDAVYHEVGLHGQTPMSVSKPYEYSIRGPAAPNKPAGEFRLVQKDSLFQISRVDSNPLIDMVMGDVNIIGMPAIKKYVVEVRIGGSGGAGGLTAKELENLDLKDLENPAIMAKLESVDAGPTVTLHEAGFKIPPTEITIPLAYTNFSRRKNPADKGPLPELADNPVIRDIKIQNLGKASTGHWLLDTGAPANLISTKQAKALGLFTETGHPARDPDFSLPLGGIGGKIEPVPGFRIDHLVIPAADGKSLDYRNVYVLVNDVSITLDTGETITLDGILGTGLWFPTVAGIGEGFPTNAAPSAFESLWIDGPNKRLHLKLHPEFAKPAPTTAPK